MTTSNSSTHTGIGFAIPIDTVKAVVEIIIRDGKVTRPATGIMFYTGQNQAKTLVSDALLICLALTLSSAKTSLFKTKIDFLLCVTAGGRKRSCRCECGSRIRC